MSKLWLTYAWADNSDRDVDHVIAELRSEGLDVHFDRAQLLVGQRIWEQLDAAIRDPSVDAWAMLVTENSLSSQPCREEISYALSRALEVSDRPFPLIGIFPCNIDANLIPGPLKSRLYVNLRDPNWKTAVANGVKQKPGTGTLTPPERYGFDIRRTSAFSFVTKEHIEGYLFEFWPRSGRWMNFFGAVFSEEFEQCLGAVARGDRGASPLTYTVNSEILEIQSQDNMIKGRISKQPIDNINAGHIILKSMPSVLFFGHSEEEWSLSSAQLINRLQK